MSKKDNLVNTLPVHADGSGDIMAIWGKAFEKCTDKSKVRVVEGSLVTLYKLVNQPYFAQALNRGAIVEILYTGPNPASDEEQRMMESIVNFDTQRRVDSLSPKERVELIQRDMFQVYQEKGLEGLAHHLTETFQKDNTPMTYDLALCVAKGFEEDVNAKRIQY